MSRSLSERIVAYKAVIVGYTIFIFGVCLIVLPKALGAPDAATNVMQVLGVALVPTGMISLVNEYFLRRDVVGQMSSLFDDFLVGHMDDLVRASQSLGTIYDANPTVRVCEAFAKAEQEILLFNGWIPDFEGLQHGLRSAIQRNVSVKVLLLNPDSSLTASRAAEIGINKPEEQHFYTSIDLDSMVRFFEQAGGHQCVEIRLFDELPVAPVYATEDEMYIGWFYKARRAVAGPVVRVNGASAPLYAVMKESFFKVWDSAHTTISYPASE
jgi:hypothetical protein